MRLSLGADSDTDNRKGSGRSWKEVGEGRSKRNTFLQASINTSAGAQGDPPACTRCWFGMKPLDPLVCVTAPEGGAASGTGLAVVPF